jgi:hypothetical protein
MRIAAGSSRISESGPVSTLPVDDAAISNVLQDGETLTLRSDGSQPYKVLQLSARQGDALRIETSASGAFLVDPRGKEDLVVASSDGATLDTTAASDGTLLLFVPVAQGSRSETRVTTIARPLSSPTPTATKRTSGTATRPRTPTRA